MVTPEEARATLPKHLTKFVEAPNGCWTWQGYRTKTGRAGNTTLNGKKMDAAAAIWVSFNGPRPEGKILGYTCEDGTNEGCVNPHHLEPMTMRERLLRSDKTLAGRNARMTHCAQGHEWTPENTYWKRNHEKGRAELSRQCRTCMRFYAKRAAEKYRDEHRQKARDRYHNDPRVKKMQLQRQVRARRRVKLARIVNYRGQGMTLADACERVGWSVTNYYYWIRRYPEYRQVDASNAHLTVETLAAMQEQETRRDATRGYGSATWDTSLDKPLGDDNETTRGDLIATAESLEDYVLDRERNEYLTDLLQVVELQQEAGEEDPARFISERMGVTQAAAARMLADVASFAAEHEGVNA